jgi:tetratricopeptide (TPR) repeat protein
MTDRWPAGISLCMIVRDEERFLAGALESVAGVVDELCIVDTGSRDATVAIAERFGARVAHLPWADDFSHARNAALALATRRWIFVLDADERLDPTARATLAAIGREPAGLRGRWVRAVNLVDDITGSGAMTNALVRIFPNDARIRYRNAIHEFVALDGSDAGLPSDLTAIDIVHHGYVREIVRDRRKAERNVRLSRAAAARDPDDPFHRYNLGMSLLMAGDAAGSSVELEAVRALTRSAPRGYRAHALVTLAGLYLDAERLDDALRTAEECCAIAPSLSSAHFVAGRILARAGRLYEARDAFGRAIAAGAHDREQFVVDNEIAIWKAHNELGATLMREERYAEALRWFELAAAQRPAAQPLLVNRAKSHEALGDLVRAGELFAAAARSGCDEPSAIEFVNFLLRRDRRADAVAAIEAALPVLGDGYRIVFLGTAASIHARAGDIAAARDALARAYRIGAPGEARATLDALATQLRDPDLGRLIAAENGARATGLRIMYTPDV